MSHRIQLLVTGSALALLVCVAGVSRGEDELWQTDFAAAKAKAKDEHKLLLVDFTGSDWCGWCIKLRGEVFDKDEFKTAAPKDFVLVELDYPAHKEQSPELKKQNNELRSKYKIHGYPTILMMDPEGEVIAHTGYRPGGPDKYVDHLQGMIKAHDEIVALKAKLDKLAGLERARALDVIVTSYEKLGAEDNADIAKYSDEIVSLDPDNKAGLKVKYTFRKMLAEAKQLTQERKLAEAKAAFEKAIALDGISDEQKQDAYFAEGECCFGMQDFVAVVDCLKKARDAAPKTEKAGDLDGMIKRFSPMADAQGAVVKLKGDADKAEGLDRAKLLDQLITAQTKFGQMMPTALHPDEIKKWEKEIVSLDPDNKAGLGTKYQVRELLAEAAKESKAGDQDKAQAALDKALKLPDLTDEQKENVKKAIEKFGKKSDKA